MAVEGSGSSSEREMDVGYLLRRLEREKRAREEVETVLAQKKTALVHANNDLQEVVRQLRDREERARVILEAAAEGIIILDQKNIIEVFNAAAEEIFGYRAEDVIGKDVNVLITAPYQEKPKVASRMRGLEAVGLRKNGSTFSMELGVSTIRQMGQLQVVMIIRDVSERRDAERELHRVNAVLERTRDEALEASRAKSAFLANMSHELRTPLNAIIGYSEMLQEEAREQNLADFVPDLQRIHTSGKHLLALINDILDLSKIEAGKMDLYLESFDLGSMIHDVVATVRPLVDKNGNELIVSVPEGVGTMRTDVTKFRQVLFNLLSNACKFTQKGKIELAVSRQPARDGDRLVFRVSDTGIGISPEQQARLFQEFTQGDGSTTRRFGGTGLGLAITRRFCRLMGGDVTLQSKPGQGSTFTIEVPMEVSQPEALSERNLGLLLPEDAARPPEPVPPADGPCILVIDDEAPVRELIQRRLNRDGFKVVTAANGVEGLKLAKEVKPRAITLDVIMPSMDGWAVLASLKADPETADIPVVMVTVSSNRSLAYAMGVTDYLVKPVDRERLVAILEKYASGRPRSSVLIVEDDLAMREMLGHHLEHMSCMVTEAASGLAALERLSESLPDLILLDLMLPEMDGFQFLETMRRHEAYRDIPVIVLSALDLSAEERARLNGRVEQILQKGATTQDELLAALREQLAAAGSRRVGAATISLT